MKPDFYAACIPEPYVILGASLKPFSLGHFILLHRLDSPFVRGGVPRLEDLVSGVFVCAMSWKDNLEVLYTGQVERRFGFLRWHEPVSRFMRRWEGRVKSFNFAEKVALFEKYIEEGCRTPLYSISESEGQPSKMPIAEALRLLLMKELHLPESELLDRPLASCLWDYIGIWERKTEGRLRFEDPEEWEALQQAAKEANGQS